MSEDKLRQQLNMLSNTNFNKDSLEQGLQVIADYAKTIVPVLTGRLRDSIHVEITDEKGYVVADTEYAGIVEYGTATREAKPYLRPAFETKTDEALKLIAQATDKKVKEVVT